MSNGQLLPLSSYNLEVLPGMPTLAVDEDFPVSIRLTMAAIDPSKADGEEPSTLRILKKPSDFPEDGLLYNSDEDDDEDEEEEEEEKEEPKKQKKGSKKEEESEEEDDEEMDEDDDDVDDEGFEIQEYALCTLGPKVAYQQPLDIVINSGEEVLFEVSGSYPIHLSGNYVEHPFDADSDDYDSDLGDSDEDDQLDDEDEYDLSPNEDELIEGSGRIQEIQEEEEKPKSKKEKKKEAKKRAAEEAEEEEKPKKQKKGEDKKVSFTKDLEQGPSGSKKAKKLEGGVTIEDRSAGEGPTVKKGDKIGVRYIGKLANGKVFDSNTKGKPFYFTVGKGEVIKGWEVGVAGMATKGERRIIIPAPMAYGKQALPGIPANSELTFDVKLVNIK
jgi:FK506-binding nuclear protein